MVLKIEGMHCDACVRRVTQVLERTGEGMVKSVDLGRAEIDSGPEQAPALISALNTAGFTAAVVQ